MYLKENILSSFNLIEGFDLPAIEEKIARYQEENAEQIMINRARKAEELAAALAASKAYPAQNDADGYACYNGSAVWKSEEDILQRMEDKLRERDKCSKG
ncbi:uncharacterized protein LOC118343793 [Juglans regia]|uniref:Uncharacterized protein LOC118343793 n=1 Tax=Juglans regia TaxID=51240 RepID=A0A6P9DT87_JUGRE|nr:uncharacterized protein LOC118343793 [Juglans regia]